MLSQNEYQTRQIGRKFASTLKGGEVLALYGDLGSGKTTFTKGLIGYFIKGKRVLSPTFIIVRHYYPEGNKIKHIIHADLYRLEKESEIEDLGISELFNRPGCIVLIEWADRMKEILPKNRLDIHFEDTGNQSRQITIT